MMFFTLSTLLLLAGITTDHNRPPISSNNWFPTTFQGCQPYPIKPLKNCSKLPEVENTECSKEWCPKSYKITNVRRLPENEYEIRKEIYYRNGPVVATMKTYSSFENYENGLVGKESGADIAVCTPPEHEQEFTELAQQHENNPLERDQVDREQHRRPDTNPSNDDVSLEIHSSEFEKLVQQLYGQWSTSGSPGIFSNLRGAKSRDRGHSRKSNSDQLEYLLPKLAKQPKDSRKRKYDEYSTGQEPPESYDARIAYPDCKSISSIIDQSNCRSCWAIAVAAVFSDRLCIQSEGEVNLNMSAGQLLSCFKENQGCSGGSPQYAWKYVEKQGLVTGGDYGSNEGCQPYPIAPVKGKSGIPLATTPECSKKRCPISYKAKDVGILLDRDEYEIRQEIYNHGPVVTGMDMYPSFEKYKGGIYLKSDSPKTKPGEHAVRIIGWGEEDGQKYWIVANSYGKEWGEDGFFKIPRGVNYCRIESLVSYATPVFKQSIFKICK